MQRTEVLADLPRLQALTHPVRLRMLDVLREAQSAAAVARVIGEPRQKVNYHLQELRRGGLVEPAGERRKGNMTEQLYRSVAGTFLVSPRVAWTDQRRGATLQQQAALAALVDLGERLQRDAAALLDHAAFDGGEIPSASVDVEVSFADAASRSAFMTEYLKALGPLLKKYGVPRNVGVSFKLALAVYPEPGHEIEQEVCQ
jgi:DNA-binding transcriptional ArsR family regulator